MTEGPGEATNSGVSDSLSALSVAIPDCAHGLSQRDESASIAVVFKTDVAPAGRALNHGVESGLSRIFGAGVIEEDRGNDAERMQDREFRNTEQIGAKENRKRDFLTRRIERIGRVRTLRAVRTRINEPAASPCGAHLRRDLVKEEVGSADRGGEVPWQ